jgi:hypothetical protein
MKIIQSIKCNLGYHKWKEIKREWRLCGRCAAESGEKYSEHLYVSYKCECCLSTQTIIEALCREDAQKKGLA